MDRLPQDLLDRIMGLVAGDGHETPNMGHKKAVSRYATVSSRFQQAVERITFRTLNLDVLGLESAPDILRRCSRWLHVRSITFGATLPPYSFGISYLETPEEMERNSEAFTGDIQEFFQLLSEWPAQDLPADYQPAPIKLLILTYSTTDKIISDYGTLLDRYGSFAVANIQPVQIWRYHRSSLTFNDSIALPSLQHVPISGIEFRPLYCYPRKIDASSLSRITSAMNPEMLKSIWWPFGDVEKRDLSLRRARRQDLANAINSLSGLDDFELECEYRPPLNHDYEPPVLYHPETEVDPVSGALRSLCQRTEVVDLRGVLGSTELFWPKAGSTEPHFESIKWLSILYHPCTPNGQWLFERDDHAPNSITYQDLVPQPDEIRGDEDNSIKEYRFAPMKDWMDEFYGAAGRAVAHMPNLHYMLLQPISFLDRVRRRLATEHLFIFVVHENRKAEAFWHSSPEYTPSDEVMKIWQNAAHELALDLEIIVQSIPSYLRQ
ncbi:hypothetical protein F4805DRAFT_472298 [Annulohypoxylon moriforme]|nr:hypothetical protein F4805DRAFT_472298 [Annulohypoxylon moriforme]